MLNFSPEKLVLVGVIALIVLGPNRLPQAARTLGKVLYEVRKVSGSFQTEVRDALAEPRADLNNAVEGMGLSEVRSTVNNVRNSVNPMNIIAPPARNGTARSSAAAGDAVVASSGPTPAPDDPSLN